MSCMSCESFISCREIHDADQSATVADARFVSASAVVGSAVSVVFITLAVLESSADTYLTDQP